MTRQSLLRSLVVIALLANCGSSFAQRRWAINNARWNSGMNQAQKQQQQSQALMKARAQLSQQELAAISAAEEQLASAKKDHRQAGKDLASTRETALKSIESSLGMKRLQDDLANAQADYKKASEPVLERLKGTDEYIAAQKKAAAAKLAIQQVQSDDSMTESEKKAKRSELFSDSMAATNLEQVALRKDQSVSNAHERVEAAQAKVGETRRKSIEKVEKDSTVTAAHQAVDAAFEQVKSAEANLASLEGKVTLAEQQLQAGILPKKASQSGGSNKSGKKN